MSAMMKETRPKLVIFDCDGVLVDSEPISNAAVADSLTKYGFPMSVEKCTELYTGWRLSEIARQVMEQGAQLPSGWIEEVYADEYEALRQGVPVIEGIPELLDRLEAVNIPFCVASNGALEKMTITLGQTGLLPRFGEGVFSAHSLGVSKPDPKLFLTASAAFDVAPAETVVIEDSLPGATGAARALMRCFAYAPHSDGAPLAATGAVPFRSMWELPKLLGL